METYEQKNRRIFGELLQSEYLEESNKLMYLRLTEKDLLSVVETDNFLTAHLLSGEPFFQTIIPFEERRILKEIFNQLILNWDIPYFFKIQLLKRLWIIKIIFIKIF